MSWETVGERYRMSTPGFTPHASDKYEHGYLPFYEQHLAGREINSVLEIGVQSGASLHLWHELFPDARIVGIDIDPRCGDLVGPFQIVVAHAATLDADRAVAGTFDLIIDDGSHLDTDTLGNLAVWSRRLAPGGVYVIEDAVIGSTSWVQSLNDVTTMLLAHGLTPFAMHRSNMEWVAHRHYGGMMSIVFADAACAIPGPFVE